MLVGNMDGDAVGTAVGKSREELGAPVVTRPVLDATVLSLSITKKGE